jgi:hypothetical protein
MARSGRSSYVQEEPEKRGRPWGLINITAPLGQRNGEQKTSNGNDSPVQHPRSIYTWRRLES